MVIDMPIGWSDAGAVWAVAGALTGAAIEGYRVAFAI
jgi:hypothetical protein